MDNSPTALFDSYEQDFKQIIASIREKLEGGDESERGDSYYDFNHSSTERSQLIEFVHAWFKQGNLLIYDLAEQRKAALRRVEMELDEADEMVSQMEIEIQGIPQSLRPSYTTRIKSAKADLTRYKKLSKDTLSALNRSDLLSSSRSPSAFATSDEPYGNDRSRLLAGTALLEDGSRRLMDSQRIALETEEQGADILRSLRGQREQIQNARDTLQRADTSIDSASGTLKKMIRRMYQQRVVTAGIVLVLILLILLILWIKFFR